MVKIVLLKLSGGILTENLIAIKTSQKNFKLKFYKQILSRSALEINKDFIYMALTLDALYLIVVIHNYFLISKVTL